MQNEIELASVEKDYPGIKNRIKYLLIIIGTLSVGLGSLGMFLPILPTTPFLLLAAACYARSSKRFYYWLLNNRWFGKYIDNYRQKKGIPLRLKVYIITMLWVTILISAIFFVDPVAIKILLIIIAIGVTIHLLSIKTLK